MPISMHDIPKKIYSLWLDPDPTTWPQTVQICFDQWQKLNPEYKFQILTREDVMECQAAFPIEMDRIPPQALSDIMRCHQLSATGGIWVDATVFPVRPLDEWLPSLTTHSGFFAFDSPGADRPISSWFLAASSEHLILNNWWAEVNRYWDRPRILLQDPRLGNAHIENPIWEVSAQGGAEKETYPYFWFHYLFSLLLETDPSFNSCWADCAKISANAPHRLQHLFRQPAPPQRDQIMQAFQDAPVHKLDWRVQYPWQSLKEICKDFLK